MRLRSGHVRKSLTWRAEWIIRFFPTEDCLLHWARSFISDWPDDPKRAS